jgi:hypothetical protein
VGNLRVTKETSGPLNREILNISQRTRANLIALRAHGERSKFSAGRGSRETLDITLVEPELVVEVGVDVARDAFVPRCADQWVPSCPKQLRRHPVHHRQDVHPAEAWGSRRRCHGCVPIVPVPAHAPAVGGEVGQ